MQSIQARVSEMLQEWSSSPESGRPVGDVHVLHQDESLLTIRFLQAGEPNQTVTLKKVADRPVERL